MSTPLPEGDLDSERARLRNLYELLDRLRTLAEMSSMDKEQQLFVLKEVHQRLHFHLGWPENNAIENGLRKLLGSFWEQASKLSDGEFALYSLGGLRARLSERVVDIQILFGLSIAGWDPIHQAEIDARERSIEKLVSDLPPPLEVRGVEKISQLAMDLHSALARINACGWPEPTTGGWHRGTTREEAVDSIFDSMEVPARTLNAVARSFLDSEATMPLRQRTVFARLDGLLQAAYGQEALSGGDNRFGRSTWKIAVLEHVGQNSFEQLQEFLLKLGGELYDAMEVPPNEIAAVAQVGETAVSQASKKSKRPRGRPRNTNPAKDRQIADAWKSGQYRNYEQLGRQIGLNKAEVENAIGRHRKREVKPRRNKSTE